MAARANISKGYRARLGIIAAALIGFGAWAAYDGFVYWPKQIDRYAAYLEVEENHPRDWQVAWQAYAAERGWPTDKPKERTPQDLWSQYGIMAITLPLGLFFLYGFVRAGGRWVESDESGLRASNGRGTDWEGVKSINKERWKAKGVAVVHFENERGEGSITLDDWKFEREPTVAILSEVEARTGLGGDEPAGADGSSGEGESPADETAEPVASTEEESHTA